MPLLTFKDGTSEVVEYGIASSVLKALNEPGHGTAEERELATKVLKVSFDDLPTTTDIGRAATRPFGHDAELDNIYKSGLRGKNLARAVAQRIKNRRCVSASEQKTLL